MLIGCCQLISYQVLQENLGEALKIAFSVQEAEKQERFN
jgi:hypothetical protein